MDLKVALAQINTKLGVVEANLEKHLEWIDRAREQGADLRSRCQLFPTGPFVWELLDQPGAEPTRFSLTGTEARALLKSAIEAATNASLPWEGIIDLSPSDDLVELVRRSQHLAAQTTGED